MQKENFSISEDCNFPGVYIIVNIKNCKCYVGSSRNIKRRLHEHEMSLRHNKHNIMELQKDYNDGCKFIAYPLSEVQLLKRKYNVDKNLRYYENEAIKLFESTDPKKGYNTNLSCENKSEEYSNIYWKKVAFESFVNVKEGRNFYRCSTKERNREIKEFITKMLKGA